MVSTTRSRNAGSLRYLVGLVFGDDGFFAYHDPKKEVIEVVPVDRSLIIHEIPTAMPFSLFIRSVHVIAPDSANAITLGYPVFRYGTTDRIDAAIHYHRIPQSDWARLIELPEPKATVKHYLLQQ